MPAVLGEVVADGDDLGAGGAGGERERAREQVTDHGGVPAEDSRIEAGMARQVLTDS